MSKLNELYRQLEIIDEELNDYIENSDNDAIVSDVPGEGFEDFEEEEEF